MTTTRHIPILLVCFVSSLSLLSQGIFCNYNNQYGYHVSGDDRVVEVLEASGERMVMVGTSQSGSRASAIRVYANGLLDPGFADVGKFLSPFADQHNVTCATIQADDRVLIGGRMTQGSNSIPYVMRLDEDGQLDTSFGAGGIVFVPFGFTNRDAHVQKIEVLSTGQIQVISFMPSTISFSQSAIITTRLLADGTLDTNYNMPNGFAIVDLPARVSFDIQSSTIAADGTCYLVDYNFNLELQVTKVEPNGLLDPLFGNNGTATFPQYTLSNAPSRMASSISIDEQLLITVSQTGQLPIVFKLDVEDGELFGAFGTGGELVVPFEAIDFECYDIIVDEVFERYILVGGTFSDPVSTLTFNIAGALLNDCGSPYHIVPVNQTLGVRFTAGLIDQSGFVRLTGQTGTQDPTLWPPVPSQGWNYMWTYFSPFPPQPLLTEMIPSTLVQGQAVGVTIKGTGLNSTQGVELFSSFETLPAVSYSFINSETLNAVFNPETTSAGLMDLRVILADDTLILEDEALVIEDGVVSASVNVTANRRLLAGGQSLYVITYKNTGNSTLMGAPLIVHNSDNYEMTFDQTQIINPEGHPSIIDLVQYVSDLGIPTAELFDTRLNTGNVEVHGVFANALAPGQCRNLAALQSMEATGTASQRVTFNPTDLIGPSGLLDAPLTPQNCREDLVKHALEQAGIELNMTNYESCFESAYSSTQEFTRELFLLENTKAIPMKLVLIQILYELALCTEGPDLGLDNEDFVAFVNKVSDLFATTEFYTEDTECPDTQGGGSGGGNDPEPDDDPSGNLDPQPDLNPGVGPEPDGALPCPDCDNCEQCDDDGGFEALSSLDPNSKMGPSQTFGGPYVNYEDWQYTVFFENIDSADLAAKTVLIVDSLDMSKVDISTFEFGLLTWGANVRSASPQADVMEYDLRPAMPNILRVTTDLDTITGVATWLFQTIDTLSLYPTTNIDHGFLPPNISAPEGMGFVQYSVSLQEGIASGTTVSNAADIFFDFNDPIRTNTWVNVYDIVPAESQVLPITDYVGGQNTATIQWDSDDDDVLYYNIYYNTDGSNEWLLWQEQSTATSGLFEGELGETYYFMSLAVDSALNVEPNPLTYDASIFMNPVSISEQDLNTAYRLYPNPTSDVVSITGFNKQLSEIQLCDFAGKILDRYDVPKESKELVIDLSPYASGMYLLKFYGQDSAALQQRKLIKY